MSAKPNRIFLLSPASCSGKRAEILSREQASFELANRLRSPGGATLGETFSFLSGLYFRGKLAYASHFAHAPNGVPKVRIITAGRGLMPPDAAVSVADLQEFASIPIDLGEPRYRGPIERDCACLAGQITGDTEVILLGSVASAKYRELLTIALAQHLRFPIDFIGRGDMSRGGLMLRCVEENRELQYSPFSGAVLRGTRPARLAPRQAKPKN